MSNSHRGESVPITSLKSQPDTATQYKGLLKRRMPTERKLPKANPPSTFHAFPNLPPELQNMIWRYSLPGPRVIRAELHSKIYLKFKDAHPSIALHVCRNSRQEALLSYKLLFKSESIYEDEDEFQPRPSRRPRPIYINPVLDTIYLISDIYDKKSLYIDFACRCPDIEKSRL